MVGWTPPSDLKSEDVRVPVAWSRRWLWRPAVGLAALVLVLLGVFNVQGVRTWLRAGGTPQIQSIAVLPLRNLSPDTSQEYFSDGLTDGLITDLAQISSLKVISHTSTAQYKDTKKPLPEIARELNVDGVIEGTVQRSGDSIRINVQLIHGLSDKHIWAKSYDRQILDILALEREVTEDITRQVQARLTTPENGVSAQPRPVDPKVLEAYLQGHYHLNGQGRGAGDEEKREAQKYFQQAIDTDPTFAPAFMGLADAHAELLLGSKEDTVIERRAAEKAVELDPNSSDARVVLGYVKWKPGLDWRGAEVDFRKAIALNPNNAKAHYLLGAILIVTGHAEEGLSHCRLAQQLDPNEDQMAFPLMLAHDTDGAIAVLQMWLRRDPENGVFHCYLFANYNKKEMYKDGIQELAQCFELFGYPEAAGRLRRAFKASGNPGAIRQWAREVERLQATHQAYLPGNLAAAYAMLGDRDRAFHWLEQAYENREMVSIDGGVFFLSVEGGYDPLRSDPRFKDLLRRVGLPP